ncbi:tRNA dihydrouridine synthase DusB [Cucumibacter marinus]|uniref:tRNA dihydrouridine synthase DusB n=1 Tax=Cucumibacter marinus TaxID=1121252 RepID=UPI000401F15D|nr:tRNA dihydrouridine synthase DusB [Cucumibacter marinus]
MERTLPEISLGNVTFPGNAFLAPLSGITDRSFRRIAERYGAGMVVSEMIASAALATGHEDMHRRLGKPARLPHMVQLAGCEAEWLAEGACIAEDAGAEIIDINMGCPAKRVTNGYAGSALMRVPDIAIGLVEAVVKAVKVPVTVKMRLGWDDADLNAPDMARRAVDAGAQMITVHGRTRQQFYKGEARWEPIRAVRDAIDVPLVVNGDILSFKDAQEALALSGADAAMIGRGAQGKPWIVGQIADQLAGRAPKPAPQGDDLAALVVEHYDLMRDEYGPELAVRCARKHIGWYLDTLAETANVDAEQRKAVLTEDDPAVVTRMLGDLFSDTGSPSAERTAA